MKNQSLKIKTLALTVILSAPCATATSNPFTQGFYLGGAVGAGMGHAEWDGVTDIFALNDGYNPTPLTPVSRYWVPAGDTDDSEFAGRALLGYQFVFQSLYFAFELGGTFSDEYRFDLNETQRFFKTDPLAGTVDAKATTVDSATLDGSEFNVDIKSGWLLTKNFLAYGRVGLGINKLTLENQGLWSTTNTSPHTIPPYPNPYTLTAYDTDKESDTAYGIRLGLGMEWMAMKHFGLTFDYVYSYYGNTNTLTSGDAANVPPPPLYYSVSGTHSSEVTVYTQTFMLGILYHW